MTHRADSSDACVHGPLPVPGLRGLLREEEVHFVVVSVVVVWDEVGGNELWVCRGEMVVSLKRPNMIKIIPRCNRLIKESNVTM